MSARITDLSVSRRIIRELRQFGTLSESDLLRRVAVVPDAGVDLAGLLADLQEAGWVVRRGDTLRLAEDAALPVALRERMAKAPSYLPLTPDRTISELNDLYRIDDRTAALLRKEPELSSWLLQSAPSLNSLSSSVGRPTLEVRRMPGDRRERLVIRVPTRMEPSEAVDALVAVFEREEPPRERPVVQFEFL